MYIDDDIPEGQMYELLLNGEQHPAQPFIGKKIVSALFVYVGDRNALRLTFDDGISIDIADHGQSCCEHRYISTDDDLDDLIGKTLAYVQVKDVDHDTGSADDSGFHEMAFVEVGTTESCVTLVTHNEHNGYYGGFALKITRS